MSRGAELGRELGTNVLWTGMGMCAQPSATRSLATSLEQRDRLKLRGLLPAGVVPLEVQVDTAMEQLRAKDKPIDQVLACVCRVWHATWAGPRLPRPQPSPLACLGLLVKLGPRLLRCWIREGFSVYGGESLSYGL